MTDSRPATGTVRAYPRVSTDPQDEQRQRDSLEALIERHYAGWPVEWYPEHGVSAYHVPVWDRPESKRMLAELEPGDVIVTDDQDRLSRGREDEQAGLRVFVVERGATIHTVTQGIVGDDIGSRIVWSVKGILANLESETKGHRISGGKETKRKAGKDHSGSRTIPPGYRRVSKDDGTLVAEQDVLDLIRQARDRLVLQGHPYQKVCDFLSATLPEETLKRFKSRHVGRDRLREWLANPIYSGYLAGEENGERKLYAHGATPAWSADEAEANERFLAKKRDKSATRAPRKWPFSGIAKCPSCGHAQRLHPVRNRHGKDYLYVRCAGDNCPERSRLPIAAAWEASALTGLAAIAYAIDDLLATDPHFGETQATENPDAIREARDEAEANLKALNKQLILTPSLRSDPDVAEALQKALQRRDTLAAHYDRLVNAAKSHRAHLREVADSLLSLSDHTEPDPWEGHIAEETLTLIDEKHGRGEPDERTTTIRHGRRTRPTMLRVIDGWRLADFEQRVAAVRAFETIKVGRERIEYRLRGIDSPLAVETPFESKRGTLIQALEDGGFGHPQTEGFTVTRVGNNRRAVNLHRAARRIASDGWPDDLTELPGVGRYTADAVARFALGAPLLPVDTNVRRVQERTGARFGPASAHALMDLGATVCLARVPRCRVCPLARGCPSRGRRYPPLRKQSRFEGSFRQRRGHTLRLVTERPRRLGELDAEAVGALARDGLVEVAHGRVRLP